MHSSTQPFVEHRRNMSQLWLIWRVLKTEVPQVTMGFNTRTAIHDLDNLGPMDWKAPYVWNCSASFESSWWNIDIWQDSKPSWYVLSLWKKNICAWNHQPRANSIIWLKNTHSQGMWQCQDRDRTNKTGQNNNDVIAQKKEQGSVIGFVYNYPLVI